MKGANSSPMPVHMKKPDQPIHCSKVRCPASTDLTSASAMVSILRPMVIETIWPSSASVPFLVSQISWLMKMRLGLSSRRAAPSHSSAREDAHEQQQNYGACKSHDHLADNRVAEHLHLDVED